jgi:hypothetical protein
MVKPQAQDIFYHHLFKLSRVFEHKYRFHIYLIPFYAKK